MEVVEYCLSSISLKSCNTKKCVVLCSLKISPFFQHKLLVDCIHGDEAAATVLHTAQTLEESTNGFRDDERVQTFGSGSSWMTEMTKTAVFPIPLLAWQMMSVPRIACGITACCTSDGCSKPQSEIAWNSCGFSIKSFHPVLCMAMCVSLLWCSKTSVS